MNDIDIVRELWDDADVGQAAYDKCRAALDRIEATLDAFAEQMSLADVDLARKDAALREIASWDSNTAKAHGDVGVREYARAALEEKP